MDGSPTLFYRCTMYWRSRRTREQKLALSRRDSVPAPPEDAPFDWVDLRIDLESLLEHLPDRMRQLLRLRYVLGFGPAAAAAIMGYRVDSVRKITTRALDRLAFLWLRGSAGPSHFP